MEQKFDFETEIAKAFDFEPSSSVDQAIRTAIRRRAWLNRHRGLSPLRITAAAAILILVGATFLLSSSSVPSSVRGVSVSKAAGARTSAAVEDPKLVAMAESLLEVQGLADDDFLCSDTSDQLLM